MGEFVMPILGADMEAGTLIEWHKQLGDVVRRGDIIADVETDKGLIEVEIFESGVLERILVQPGQKVPVGTVLALIRAEGALPARPVPAEAPSGRLRVSPAARKLASELGVDLERVRGTGPDGAIQREDVERAAGATRVARVALKPLPTDVAQAEPSGVAPPTATQEKIDRSARMRQAIGAAMARSKREIPHYYLSSTVDMHRALEWLAEQNLKRPVADRLLYGVLLIKAVAIALKEVPELNALWSSGGAMPNAAIHVGVAVSLRGGGLIAPALHDTDRKSLDELWATFRDLVKRARSGGLRSSELSDSTITVTSLGEQGVETVFPIIYPPQVAIVGFGKIVERPWSVDGQVVSRPVVTATLAADHRVTDGHRGAMFLAAVDRLLQQPEKL